MHNVGFNVDLSWLIFARMPSSTLFSFFFWGEGGGGFRFPSKSLDAKEGGFVPKLLGNLSQTKPGPPETPDSIPSSHPQSDPF